MRFLALTVKYGWCGGGTTVFTYYVYEQLRYHPADNVNIEIGELVYGSSCPSLRTFTPGTVIANPDPDVSMHFYAHFLVHKGQIDQTCRLPEISFIYVHLRNA